MNTNDFNENLLPDFDDMVIDLPIPGEVKTPDTILPIDTPVPLDTEEEETKQEEPTLNNNIESDEQAVIAFKTLVDKGVLPDDESFEGTWESLENRMEQLPNLVAQSIINNAPDITKKVIEFSYLKEDITLEDLKSFVNSLAEDLSDKSIDYNNLDEVKTYIENTYRKQGLNPKVIKSAIETLENEDFDGEALKEEAKTLLEKDKGNSKTDTLIENEKVNKQDRINQEKIFVENVTNEIKATGWSDAKVKEVSEVLKSNQVSKVIQDAFSSPKALVQLANLATYFDSEKKYFNFEDFIKKASSPEIEKTKKSILRDSWNATNNTSSIPNNNNKTNISFVPILD